MTPAIHPTQPTESPRRIVLTTFGSLGDLHPYIAIALGLQARGHHVIVATSACYQHKIQSLGLGFHAIRPDSAFVTDPAIMHRFMDLHWGTVHIGRELIGPSMRQTYEDTLAASKDADLLVSHPLTGYTTRLVAEKTGIPWVSTMITPLGFLSAHDVPLIPISPLLSKCLRLLGPTTSIPLLWLFKRASRFLAEPWYRLRAEIGLPSTNELNPLIDSHSPHLVLALFSKLLADKQPDWPPQTLLTGFPLHDQDTNIESSAIDHPAPISHPSSSASRAGPSPAPVSSRQSILDARLVRFLDDGPPPLVFTLSWSAATVAGPFFENSIAAAKLLGRRAVLITGNNPHYLPSTLPPGIAAFDYAPFSQLFPRAAAIIHPGGIGTTGLAMRAGRPMLLVPYSHDHPDNAARAARLGIARLLPRHRYTPPRAAAELRHLLDDPHYARRAGQIAEQIHQEDGTRTACDALEQILNSNGQSAEAAPAAYRCSSVPH